MPVELWWIGGGGAAVLAALVWRQVHLLRTRRQLARALADADPVRRRAALAVAFEQGLRPYAGLLVGRVEAETDPAVRAVLARGVLRCAWEPADRRAVLQLRLWAQEEAGRRAAPDRANLDPPTAPIPVPHPRTPRPVARPVRQPPATPAGAVQLNGRHHSGAAAVNGHS